MKTPDTVTMKFSLFALILGVLGHQMSVIKEDADAKAALDAKLQAEDSSLSDLQSQLALMKADVTQPLPDKYAASLQAIISQDTSGQAALGSFGDDGTVLTTGDDGTTTATAVDGTITVTSPTGVITVTDPDGNVTVTDKDGTATTTGKDGTIKVARADGSSTVTTPDGSVTSTAADGTVTTTTLAEIAAAASATGDAEIPAAGSSTSASPSAS